MGFLKEGFMAWLLAAVLLGAPQDEKFSGPQKGEKTAPFKVFDVASRQDLDCVEEWKGAPTLLVFIHELTRPGAALMRALDDHAQVKQVRGLKALFVSLSEDRDGAERRLPQVVKSINLRSMLGISLDGREGPGAYGLNREVTLTVVVARDNKVAANFALLSPNETDAPRIRAAIDDVLKVQAEPPAGTPEELKAEVLRLREEVMTLKEEVAALKLQAQRQATREGAAGRRMEAPAEKPKEDERLVNLCRRLIQPRAAEADIEAAVKDIEAYIAESDALKKQYADILGRILDLKYGNEIGQAAMRKQLEKYKK
jgi:hypothetical protein